jgi:DHA2 family multidrug resistance protein
VCGISAVVFFERVFTAREPIVDLRAFADRNFALGSLFSFIMGIGLYGLTLLYPLYLGQIRGYDSLMIGDTMFVSGLAMFAAAPVAGRLVGKVDPRFMLVVGFALFALGTWWMTALTRDWDFWELFWPQIFRGIGLMIAMIPINNVALGNLPPDRIKNASGLFNLTRNLGGAVGLALIYTFLNDRTDLHIVRLHEALTWARQPAVETLNNFTAAFGGSSDASAMALKQLTLITHRQAVVMAFADVFWALTALFVGLIFLVAIMKKPAANPAGGAGGH